MSYHEQLVVQLARQVELPYDPSVEVAPGAQPSSSVRDRRVTLPEETRPGEGDLVHAGAHEVVHLVRADRSLDANPKHRKIRLAREAARWFAMEVGVERGVARDFPGVDARTHYDTPFPTMQPRPRQAAWALHLAVLSRLGHGSDRPAPEWVRRLGHLAAQAERSGDLEPLATQLCRDLTKREILELLRQNGQPEPRPKPRPHDLSEPSDSADQGGGEAVDHAAGQGVFVRGAAAPGGGIEALPGLGGLDVGRLILDPPDRLRRARGGGVLGRPAAAIAQRTLFRHAHEAHRTWILIVASAYEQGASDCLWGAAETLRELLPADRVLAVTRRVEGGRFALRVLRDPSRSQLQDLCDGHSPLPWILERLATGKMAVPEHLVVLHGCIDPWCDESRAHVATLGARGHRVSRVGHRAWRGSMRWLMEVGALETENPVRCLTEAHRAP